MLFLVYHIRYLAKTEDLASPAMRVHLRIIPALAAERLDDDLLICSAPYFNTTAFLTQWPLAAIALYDGLSVIEDAAQFIVLVVCSHKKTLYYFLKVTANAMPRFIPGLCIMISTYCVVRWQFARPCYSFKALCLCTIVWYSGHN
jgi:L-lactate permease